MTTERVRSWSICAVCLGLLFALCGLPIHADIDGDVRAGAYTDAEAAMVGRPPDPANIRVEAVLRRERSAHALEHEVFGCGPSVHLPTRSDTVLQRWRPRLAVTSVNRLVPLGYWGEPHPATMGPWSARRFA